MARLVWTEGAEERTVPVGDGPTVLGTDAHCAVRLSGGDVSAVHCELRRGPDGWSVVDLESRQGTKVDGRYVNQARVGDGAVIEVGGVRVTFHLDAADARAAAPALVGLAAPPVVPVVPAVSARSRAPVPRAQRAAATARGDAEGREDAEERRPDRRRKTGDRTTTMLLMGAGVIGIFIVGWLLIQSFGGDTPNHRRRIEMVAAERRMDWNEVLRIGAEATDDGSHDWQDIQALLDRARKAQAGQVTGQRVVQSNEAWNQIRVWRQENRQEDAEYVRRLDAYLAQWGDLASDGVNLAKADRLRVTGTSSTGTGAGGPLQVLLDDLRIHEKDGTFREAFAKIDAFVAGPGASDATLAAQAETERARLLTAARKWFDKQVALARHYHGNGERNKARKTLSAAADKVGLPELEDRAKAELDSLK